jgi:nicotinamide-nucleotide adenylyltransferase
MKQALFVGRFQPFHLGHLSVIKKALETEDRLIIVIGSAEENHEPDNPFTAGERFQMIETALKAEGITHDQFTIIPIRNVENFILWTAHVDQYIPPIYKVYTGSQIVKELYLEQGKYEIEDVEMVSEISGTGIREKMLKGDERWEKQVHQDVVKLIKKWKGVERLRMVS